MELGYIVESDHQGVPMLRRQEGGWLTKERAVKAYIDSIKEIRLNNIDKVNRAMNRITSLSRKIRMAEKL